MKNFRNVKNKKTKLIIENDPLSELLEPYKNNEFI